MTPQPSEAMHRNEMYFATPTLWPTWPFLPVIRHRAEGGYECGLLCDCWTLARLPGFRATVFLANLFDLPATEREFLNLPKEVFDTPGEIARAGWVLD